MKGRPVKAPRFRLVPNANPDATAAEPPARLTAGAKSIWIETAAKLDASGFEIPEIDDELFANYCEIASTARQLTELIEESGLLVPDERGVLRKNPAIATRNQAVVSLRQLSAELGISPGARGRLQRQEGSREVNPFDQF